LWRLIHRRPVRPATLGAAAERVLAAMCLQVDLPSVDPVHLIEGSETMKRAGLAAAAISVTMMMSLSACAGGAGGASSKAGGDPAPVTLRIGTADEPGLPGADAIEEFARQVREISDGHLLIEPVWQAAGVGADDWDQQVARMVVSGDLDMGMIPARAWDTEGVTSLRAVHAPFLVTSEALLEQVVTTDVAGEMLAGLGEAGVTGLTLVPEGLRQIFSFGEPLLAPEDFEGVTVRAPWSETTYALFEALGATADDPSGELFGQAVTAGTVTAAESEFALAVALPRSATVTGNLTLFPKINSLVINEDVFAALDESQQQTLRDAAAATRDWGVGLLRPAADDAAGFCADGGTVVLADAADLAAFQSAAEPVYAELEQDPQTKALIERIRDLGSRTATLAPVAACAPVEATPTSQPSTGEFPEGVYRMQISEQDFLDVGINQILATDHTGVWTMTFQAEGSLTIQSVPSPEGAEEGSSVYCVAGERVTIVVDTDRCGDDSGLALFSAEWTLQDDQLVFRAIRSEDEGPQFQLFHETLWGSQTWEKIG